LKPLLLSSFKDQLSKKTMKRGRRKGKGRGDLGSLWKKQKKPWAV